MNMEEIYANFEEKKVFENSEIGIILEENITEVNFDKILENLKMEKEFSEIRLLKTNEKIIGSIKFKNLDYNIEIKILNEEQFEKDEENINFLAYMNRLTEDEIKKWKNSKFTIVLNMKFLNNADEDYFAQLKILDAINFDYVLIFDTNAQKVFSANWGKMLLQDNLLPLNSSLFSIHNSYDAENNEYWIHTHGLLRCGCIELEMIKIAQENLNSFEALNRIAIKFIEEGTYKRNTEILAGYFENTYLKYTWKPWEEALKIYSKYGKKRVNFLGCLEDRDKSHSVCSGALFAFENGKLQNPNFYSLILKNNVGFFYTNKEAEKMAKMAKIRFKYLKEIFKKDGDINKYLVKVGLQTDGNLDFSKENLWFEITKVGEEIKGILLNDTLDIANMQKGKEYTINEENFTDWNIFLENKSVLNPDNVYFYFK